MVKVIFKALASLFSLPFLLPWYLSDKAFEYLFQPSIFRKHGLEVPRTKIRVMRSIQILVSVLFFSFLIARTVIWVMIYKGFAGSPNELYDGFLQEMQDFRILFWIFLIIKAFAFVFIKILNFLVLGPIRQMVKYLSGMPIYQFQDFAISFYLCTVLIIFIVNLSYRLLKTRRSIKQAVALRNKAVQNVDIVHFSEKAGDDEIFLGLDLNRGHKPLYAKRAWLKGHVQVVGSPGTGKTESIIHPIWFQEIRRNVATIALDGRGSRQNVDKIYTVAASLAQAQDIYYFNPLDPERSSTYNPILRGSASQARHKIMASINWAEQPGAARESLNFTLDIFFRAMQETRTPFMLRELLEYFQSPEHIRRQLERIGDSYVQNGLQDILSRFTVFQTNTSFFIGILRDLCQSNYARLLNTEAPEIEIVGIYYGRKDCYFTVPLQSDEISARFLGRLILQDIHYSFQHIAMRPGEGGAEEGLLIIDEMVKFVSPHFIELLQASRNVGVSVCYTNQSLTELEDPGLNLTRNFLDRLAEQTNMICCFQLGSPESIQMMIERFGKTESSAESDGKEKKPESPVIDPDFLRQLDVGKCVLFIRRPRYLTTLKTGYFKFDKAIKFSGQQEEAEINVVN